MTKKGFVEAEDGVSDKDLEKAVSRAGYKLIKIE